jgi:hypothetical protein
MNDEWDKAILETALMILSKLEKNKHVPKFTIDDLKKHMPELSPYPPDAYIDLILDDEFNKRYSGKQIVYFMKTNG